jgi:hypothetical protein
MGGAFATKDFIRNDAIEGQGKEVLTFCKTVRITKYELSRLFHFFQAYEDKKTHVIALESFFRLVQAPYSLFASIFFQLYDIHKTGGIAFNDFMIMFWILLTADEESLALLCFSIFDLDM